jgi:hypothetical protein
MFIYYSLFIFFIFLDAVERLQWNEQKNENNNNNNTTIYPNVMKSCLKQYPDRDDKREQVRS